MVMIAFGAVFALATVVYVIRLAFSRQAGEIGGWQLRGSRQVIFAVARATLAEGVRARIASGFALIILASVPFFWFTADGDGTIKGKVQMYVTYSLGFCGFLLALLTVFFATRSLANEIAGRQIYGLVSKPVPRWQILAGKWLGVMALNTALIAYVGIGVYVGTIAIVQNFNRVLQHELATSGGLSPEQAANAVAALKRVEGPGKEGMESPIVYEMAQATGMTERQIGDVLLKLPEPVRVDLRRSDELRRQVLVARATVMPELPREEIRRMAAEQYDALAKEGRLPTAMSRREVRTQIERNLYGQYCTIAPGTRRTWTLKGPRPENRLDFFMSVRFKIHVGASLLAYQDPATGDLLEKDTLYCIWAVGDPSTADFAELEAPQPVRTFKEVEIPSRCIKEDGTIQLGFANIDPRRVDAVITLPEAVQVLYRVGTFRMNVFQACLAMLVPLVCLASFGVCASTFLSFPVGSMILVVLYLISISMGFAAESLAVSDDYAPAERDRGLDWIIRRAVVDAVTAGLSFGNMEPTDQLIEGRRVDWWGGWKAELTWKELLSAWPFALVKSAVVFIIAVLIFRRRELAAIIV